MVGHFKGGGIPKRRDTARKTIRNRVHFFNLTASANEILNTTSDFSYLNGEV